MKRIKERWYLIVIVLATLAIQITAVAPFKKVSIATSTTSNTTSTETPTSAAEETKSENATSSGPTKNSKLTGIPQIDYIWDPNLPRELRGYNLSSYPFHSTVPPDEDIHFKCDGLHDGFYASIEHKCQVYHHCVYGIRHDFLCANFTAFDQKTFICHFVSDVDCEGSQKYWNRNDALYMATTTTSTTTTTTEPPPTARRRPVRPLRPLRRPVNRRPVDDYYYEDEEYDDDYYEERLNARRKQQRPRQRKPQLEYDDEYDEKRSLSDDEKPKRPHSSRDRFRDSEPDIEDDYDNDKRKHDQPKARNKANLPAERRKTGSRKPIAISGRSGADERRSFSDDKPSTHNARKDKLRPVSEDTIDTPEAYPRRNGNAGRRRANEKRPTSTTSAIADVDDLDYYEKNPSSEHGEEDATAEEVPSKTKTTAKPLEEFITPKAPGTSVFARPRAPPRIPRPVPVNEKKKFEYPVQKSTTAAANTEDEYEEYDDHSDGRGRLHATDGRRRIEDDSSVDSLAGRRRTANDTPFVGRKPGRTTLRKPITEKTHLMADDDYEASNERFDGRVSGARKRPYGRPRTPIRGNEDVDFVDDEYDEQPQRPAHRLRPKASARKSPKKSRPILDEEAEDEDLYEAEPEKPSRHRANINSNVGNHRTVTNAKLRQTTATVAPIQQDDSKLESDFEEDAESAATPNKPLVTLSGRPASVRVVKRPFLPSRGGSPYLPRGLQPVGIAHRATGSSQTTDSTPIDMGSTISGVRLLEHGAPILRDLGKERESSSNQFAEVGHSNSRTTLPPRSALPVVPQIRQDPQTHKAILDELYETDYDVTLNDALNPTLKPLPNHHHHSNRNYANVFASSAPSASNSFVHNNQSPAVYHNININNNNNDNDNDNENKNDNDNDNYQHQHQQHQIAYQTLSPHQPQSQVSSPHHIQSHNQHQSSSNNFNSDSYFSSTDIRRRAIIVPAPKAHSSRSTEHRGVGTRIAQHFYDDFDY